MLELLRQQGTLEFQGTFSEMAVLRSKRVDSSVDLGVAVCKTRKRNAIN
jgi:hypothetical protein